MLHWLSSKLFYKSSCPYGYEIICSNRFILIRFIMSRLKHLCSLMCAHSWMLIWWSGHVHVKSIGLLYYVNGFRACSYPWIDRVLIVSGVLCYLKVMVVFYLWLSLFSQVTSRWLCLYHHPQMYRGELIDPLSYVAFWKRNSYLRCRISQMWLVISVFLPQPINQPINCLRLTQSVIFVWSYCILYYKGFSD